MQSKELIVNRPKYASLWQQTLFRLCRTTKKSEAVTALQQEDVAVLTQLETRKQTQNAFSKSRTASALHWSPG